MGSYSGLSMTAAARLMRREFGGTYPVCVSPGRFEAVLGSVCAAVYLDNRFGRVRFDLSFDGGDPLVRMYDPSTLDRDEVAEGLFETWRRAVRLQEWIDDNGADACHAEIDYYA